MGVLFITYLGSFDDQGRIETLHNGHIIHAASAFKATIKTDPPTFTCAMAFSLCSLTPRSSHRGV